MPTSARPSLDVLLPILRCPVTLAALETSDGSLVTSDGARRYPMAGGVPVLLAAENPLFRAEDFVREPSAAPAGGFSRARRIANHLPQGSRNVGAHDRFARVAALVRERGAGARLLVVGGGTLGAGSEALLGIDGLDVIQTDVFIGEQTDVVCDGHALPFAAGSFDAVVCQAVLEHVLEPWTVVAEIHRVLAPGGLVYSEIPFMQQVHEGAYDFTRFTHRGHRRLFRWFDEIDSGAQGGPGMALSWSAQYFVMAFAPSRPLRALVQRVVGLLTAWLTVFDPWLCAGRAAWTRRRAHGSSGGAATRRCPTTRSSRATGGRAPARIGEGRC